MTFQLTPLLDLLLIVFFAQYLELQDVSSRQEQQSVAQHAAVEDQTRHLESELQALSQRYATSSEELARTRAELMTLRQTADSHDMQVRLLEESLARVTGQRDTIASLLTDVFRVSAETSSQLLSTRTPENARLTPEQLERLRTEFQNLGSMQPGEAVRHLLTFEEMRKRCDVWELYIADSGITYGQAGSHSFRFRASAVEDFERELFQQYKSLPQPKGLVILLLSFGDVRASVYEAAIQGLPRAADRMRNDQNGRSRFEYAVLGYTPTPPIPVPAQ